MTSQLKKWMIYQKERFPLVKYAVLVAAFAASGLALSYLLTGAHFPLTLQMFLVAFTVTFLIFFQLRVADEHKDFAFDAEFHPERPVPRGLVTLHELRVLAVASSIIQIAACLLVSAKLLLPLAAAWVYMWLMTKEFFCADWLRSHPIIYMLTHMCILFFTDLFITSCHFLVADAAPPLALGYFLATSFCLGTVIEVGRKIRSPEDESRGGDTYSHLWGRSTAVKVWLSAIAISAVFAISTAAQIHSGMMALFVLIGMLLLCTRTGSMFLAASTPDRARKIDSLSGLWTLTTYLMVGLIPLMVR